MIELFIVFSKTEAHKSFGTLHNIIFYRVVELLFNTDEDLIRCMNSTAQLIVITITTLSIFLLTISMLDGIADFQVQKDDIQILYPLKVAYVFAAEGEQLRCTDGKLASSEISVLPQTDAHPHRITPCPIVFRKHPRIRRWQVPIYKIQLMKHNTAPLSG